jgi:hypothetical protein
MAQDDRNLLEVLKFELSFVEAGGYGRSPREPWRSKLALEDSPTCMNYDAQLDRQPCSECVLMQLVPPSELGQRIPCRHIPLTSQGETLDSLYATGTQQEIEDALAAWLRVTIQQLEAEQIKAANLIGFEDPEQRVPVVRS